MNNLTKELATALAKGETIVSAGLLPNPDTVLRQRGEAKSTYDKVMNDPRVIATMGSRKAGIKKLLWEVKSSGDDAAREFAAEWLSGLDLNYIFSKILDAPQYGMQPLEVMWRHDGRKLVPESVVDKPFDWFGFHNETGELRFKVRGKPEGIAVPDKKILLPRYEHSYDNPYGRPLLSLCFWPVAMKRGALPIYLNYIERFGSARWLATLPKSATDQEHDAALDAIERLISDAAATIEEGAKVEMLESSTKTSTDDIFGNFLSYCDQDITLVQLGQLLTTSDGGGSGSYALGKVHGDVRSDIIDGDAALVEQTMNTLIHWVHELNYGDAATAPVFGMYTEEDVDQALAERDNTLAATGQIRFTKSYFMKSYGFAEDDIVVESASQTPMLPLERG
jgi:phage gp29-like protein